MPTQALQEIMEKRVEYYEKNKRTPRRIYVSQWFLDKLMRDIEFKQTLLYTSLMPNNNDIQSVGKIYGMEVILVEDFRLARDVWDDY